MRVNIRRLSPLTGDEELVGTLTLVKGKIVAEPADSVSLQQILDTTWQTEVDGKVIKLNAQERPEEFLSLLSRVLKSVYTWATEPIEDKARV